MTYYICQSHFIRFFSWYLDRKIFFPSKWYGLRQDLFGIQRTACLSAIAVFDHADILHSLPADINAFNDILVLKDDAKDAWYLCSFLSVRLIHSYQEQHKDNMSLLTPNTIYLMACPHTHFSVPC